MDREDLSKLPGQAAVFTQSDGKSAALRFGDSDFFGLFRDLFD